MNYRDISDLLNIPKARAPECAAELTYSQRQARSNSIQVQILRSIDFLKR